MVRVRLGALCIFLPGMLTFVCIARETPTRLGYSEPIPPSNRPLTTLLTGLGGPRFRLSLRGQCLTS